jgi:hypothetical protein
MPAIITDQFRILNAETFAKSLTGIGTTSNYYYTFLAHPNPTNVSIEDYGDSNWSSEPPEPKDSFEQEDRYHDSMLFLKRVTTNDIARVLPRIDWTSGITYDMYRNDYDINNEAPQTSSKTLYESRFYVVNSEFKVYICLNNGANPDNPSGQKSLIEPNFVDTIPQVAGNGSDGYLWKYLYTIAPADIIKFATEKYIPVPKNWGDASTETVKNAAVRGKIETVIIKNRGSGYSIAGDGSSGVVTNVPILGDGTGGEVSITTTGGEVTKVEVTTPGINYTRGLVNFSTTSAGSKTVTAGSGAVFEVITPPKGGHGADIYRELGAYRIMIYSKYDADPDYVVGNTFSRVGLVLNPTEYGSQTAILNTSTATNLGALKLTGTDPEQTIYPLNAEIRQTVGAGQTAVGYVASWNRNTGILRYYQPVGLSTITNNDYRQLDFSGGSGANDITCTTIENNVLAPDASFNGSTITIGGKIIDLGQTFTNGKANPDVEKYSGDIIYIDNRAPITRSSSQKEEVKIVVEF